MMHSCLAHPLTLVFGLGCIACATLGSEPGDEDAARPNAHAGPFRELMNGEIAAGSGIAPYVLPRDDDRRYRDPSALSPARRGGPALEVALYVTAQLSTGSGIFRFVAPDARSFAPQPAPLAPVLTAALEWEGDSVAQPSAVWADGEVWLAYSAQAGIGLARSLDGIQFERLKEPILIGDTSVEWEGGAVPQSPALLLAGPGDYRLFYSAAGRIGEASSREGTHWVRTGDPVLAPGSDDAFDAGSVSDPVAVLATSPEGRLATRVYYTATNAEDALSIGWAARFGLTGGLERAPSPVLATAREPRSPAIFSADTFTLLYAVEHAGLAQGLRFEAVAAAVAPTDISLSVDAR